MGFWGIEVKPGKPYPYHSDNVPGSLHITQATLGLGSSTERSILQCSVGHNDPIFLCSLMPNKIESCPLDLEFDDEDLVAFSIIGSRSIHLSGFFVPNEEDVIKDDYESDSFGEDIVGTDSDSSDYNMEDAYDGDLDMYPPSPIPNSGVIEKIGDDVAQNGDDQYKHLKKDQSNSDGIENSSQQQIVVKRNARKTVLESEDEDGFPISSKDNGKINNNKNEAGPQVEHKDERTDANVKKRKTKDNEAKDRQKKKKKSKQKEQDKDGKSHESQDDNDSGERRMEVKKDNNLYQDFPTTKEHHKELSNDRDLGTAHDNRESHSGEMKKKKKKKKKGKEIERGAGVHPSTEKNGSILSVDNEKEAKSSQVRTFANGLVIEEISMGKPDGKRASHGNQVSVHYIGKLEKNGKIFDSNIGRAPFKFRLGVGSVIKGWDLGVEGMRVGDKRRLTIPPSMGYGEKGAGGKIPGNSWLVFDVELVAVR